MKGELVSNVLGSAALFSRANLAMCKGVMSCFAVPIVVFGRSTAVILFYDTDPRFDTDSLKLAETIAGSIGTVFGAHIGEKADSRSVNGTTSREQKPPKRIRTEL